MQLRSDQWSDGDGDVSSFVTDNLALVSGSGRAIITLDPGDTVVIGDGPVVVRTAAVPDVDVPADRVDISTIDDAEPVYVTVSADHGHARVAPELAPGRTCIERIVAVLHDSWHPWSDDHARPDRPDYHIRTACHDGYPAHWHDESGTVFWLQGFDDGVTGLEYDELVGHLADIGLAVTTKRP